MTKFKVGDRVRGDDNYSFDPAVGTIKVLGEYGSCAWVAVDGDETGDGDGTGTWAYPVWCLELIPTFELGDRVRLTQDNEGFGRKGDVGRVVRVDGFPRVAFENGTEVWVDFDRLERVGGIRIEAGKFYRTEAGAKVGPMSFWSNTCTGGTEFDCLYTDTHPGLWKPDGSAYFPFAEDSPKLVAEWIEPIAAPVTAGGAPTRFTLKNPPPVGTRVKLGNGDVATVSRFDGNALYFSDRLHEWYLHDDESSSDCTLVASDPTTAHSIVCLIDDGQPKPAEYPVTHDTVDEAKKEAGRLARVHPGKEFGVYTLGASCRTEMSYDHEWQRLAADGSTVAAIKSFRALSGAGLKASKDAVEDWLERQVRAA